MTTHVAIDEWLEAELDVLSEKCERMSQAVCDAENGDYWFTVEVRPAYSDKGQNPIIVTSERKPRIALCASGNGRDKTPIKELIAQAEVIFQEEYHDDRPYAMMVCEALLHFESGFCYVFKRDDDGEWRIKRAH